MKMIKRGNLIIAFIFLLSACTSPKFIVISKEPSNVEDYCVFDLKPINRQAFKTKVDGLFSECGSCKVGDTLIVNRKKYTNY